MQGEPGLSGNATPTQRLELGTGLERDYVFCALCVFTHINISVNTRALL